MSEESRRRAFDPADFAALAWGGLFLVVVEGVRVLVLGELPDEEPGPHAVFLAGAALTLLVWAIHAVPAALACRYLARVVPWPWLPWAAVAALFALSCQETVMHGDGIVSHPQYGILRPAVLVGAPLGVVPLLTSIMPRGDDPEADAQVPLYNAIVRGIAQAWRVPLIDFHRELVPLPDHGLAGDGIHPSVYVDGGRARACVFTPEGLAYGYNIRNLVTIEALDQAKRVLVDGEPPLDAATEVPAAEGSRLDPVPVDGLPFTDVRNTLFSESRVIDAYGGCEASQDESGPEYFYRLDLDAPARIRAWVLDRGTADIDLHLLDDTATPEGCLSRAHRELEADLPAGTFHLVLDTFVSSDGTENAGEYLLVVMAD